jgi:hypothetical protein
VILNPFLNCFPPIHEPPFTNVIFSELYQELLDGKFKQPISLFHIHRLRTKS